MGLLIELTDAFQLRTSAPGQLPLPRIVLIPDGPGSPPHLAGIKLTVTGQPASLIRPVQAAYPMPALRSEVKLTEARALARTPVATFTGPLPHDASLKLQVEVTYYDSDSLGQPIKTEPGAKSKPVPALRTVRKESVLHARPPEPPTLEVSPDELDLQVLLTAGGRAEPAILTVRVNNPLPGAAPRVTLRTPEVVVNPEARQALLDAVQAPLTRIDVRESDGQETYQARLQLRLSDAGKQALARETSLRPTSIGLTTEIPGAGPDQPALASVAHLLTLRCDEGDFPGWLAIDFGTSNSTVTIYDKSESRQVVVPRELADFLRQKLMEWVTQQAADAVPGCSEHDWKQFREAAVSGTEAGLGLDRLKAALGGSATDLLETLRRLESNLARHHDDRFRRLGFRKLNEIYTSAFRVPCLSVRQMVPAELGEQGTEIVSEIEVKALTRPLVIEMGTKVHQERLASIALAQSGGEPLEKVRDRYHPSPKRYFCRDKQWQIEVGGQRRQVDANELAQAAWGKLVELANAFRRQPGSKISPGRFREVIVTYPTAAPPEARVQVERLVTELGFKRVHTDYDEAISAAIFYTLREFGGDLGSGLDSFKTRCTRHTATFRGHPRTRWSMNLLVLDVGGGTTDLALIRLELEERDPFVDGESRGAGGRYYVITPHLLGSTGHPNLGGELITLRIFHLLKAALADRVLQAVAEGTLRSPTLERIVGELPQEFRDRGGYKKGSIPGAIVEGLRGGDGEESLSEAARNAAEKVFPTQWHNDPPRLQTFYTLWDLAEKAKIELGGKRQILDMPIDGYVVPGDVVLALLRQVGVADAQPAQEVRDLKASLPYKHFSDAVDAIIKEAVELADSFVTSRLKLRDEKRRAEERRRGGNEAAVPRERLDWLILSGKSCKLQALKREVSRVFSRADYFDFSPERITFAEEYAKLATSIGACWAHQLRTSAFDEQGAKEALRQGFNQLRFEVKNLFFNLPCSLVRAAQGGTLDIFRTGEELKQLDAPVGAVPDGERLGKARSAWTAASQQEIDLFRQDYETQKVRPLWAFFKVKEGLGFTNDAEFNDFVRDIRAQFEVDHKLRVRLFLCRGEPCYEPVYSGGLVLDVKPALAKLQAEAPPQEGAPDKVEGLPVLDYEIAVGVVEGAAAGRPEARQTIFRLGSPLDKRFRLAGNITRAGAISLALPEFRRTTDSRYFHDFYLGRPGHDTWYRIDTVSRPPITSEYPCDYHATIDAEGYLTVCAGEVPYWLAGKPEGNAQKLLSVPGLVVTLDPVPKAEKLDTSRDPYSGTH